MKLYNQYTDDVRKYNEENGTDIFLEYKNPNTSDERKEEIVEWLYNLIRSKGEIPQVIYSDYDIYQVFNQLSNIDSTTVYHDNAYWFNSTGVRVLNNFFPEMFDVSKDNMPSVRNFFTKEHQMKRLVRKTLTMSSSELGLSSMFFICGAGWCSNFRPATAKAIYELFGKKDNCRVLDSSAGYGARLLGAHFAKNVIEYVGIDPNTSESCIKLIEFLSKWTQTNTYEKVLKMGSEDFTKENFPQYENYFDLYFTSPPYFDTEQYSQDSTQSYIKFPRYDLWVKGFYQSTINNACDALKRDGIFIINMFEKVPKIKELTKLFLANNGWYVFKEDKYMLRSVPGAVNDENGNKVRRDTTIGNNYEPIWYAKHYTELYDSGLIDRDTYIKYRDRVSRGNKDVYR